MPASSIALFLVLWPILFVGLWVLVGLLLGVASGWRTLERRFPDREDEVLERLGLQSGVMAGAVRMNSILTFTICPGGLRIAIWRIFGFFCGPFYVPWSELSIAPAPGLLGPRRMLAFGRPPTGRITVSAKLAERISRAAPVSG